MCLAAFCLVETRRGSERNEKLTHFSLQFASQVLKMEGLGGRGFSLTKHFSIDEICLDQKLRLADSESPKL